MTIIVKPATKARFDDVTTMIGPKNPTSTVCWCLSYRLASKENRELTAQARGEEMARLCRRRLAPGVLGYDGDEVVGWAGVAPREQLHGYRRGSRIPWIEDDVDPAALWSVHCLRVRPGHRGTGITAALITGAVGFARDHHAEMIEAYPVDNKGAKVDLTMAYVGTRAMFADAGFSYAGPTESRLDRKQRVIMRLALRS